MKTPVRCTAAAMATLLAGCAAVEESEDPGIKCRDRLVTVNHASGYLSVYPENVEVCRDFNVIIKIVPSRTARTEPGDAQQVDWLREESRSGRIKIHVRADAAYDEYKYNLFVEGVGSLDPRITVSR